MSGENETVPMTEAVRSLEAMGRQLRKVRQERDQYRTWFNTLLEAAWAHAGDNAELRAALEKVQAD